MIELRGLCAGYGGNAVLQDVSLTFQPGEVLILLGPNGCGKSTLLRTLLGLQPPLSGEVLFDGVDARSLTSRQIARKAAYLTQSRNVPNIIAHRMVLHGRFPYLSFPRRYRPEDHAAAAQALEWLDAAAIADRPLTELSGGQRQKIYIAMLLAQQTQTVLMDEPTTYLDVCHQLNVMALARRLADQGKSVVLVLHDLCMALSNADRVAILDKGRLLAVDRPETVFDSGLLDQVFHISLRRICTEDGYQYYCTSRRYAEEAYAVSPAQEMV